MASQDREHRKALQRSGNACLALPGVLAVMAAAIALFVAEFEGKGAGYVQVTRIDGIERG